jgi:hypothetical protein
VYRITERQNVKSVAIRVIVNFESHEILFALIRVTGKILNKHTHTHTHTYIYIYIYI